MTLGNFHTAILTLTFMSKNMSFFVQTDFHFIFWTNAPRICKNIAAIRLNGSPALC